MLEILALIAMGKSIAAKARAKGRSGTPYVFLLLALWFGGEIFGAIVAAILTEPDANGEPNMLVMYLGALVCAAIGAVIAFVIVGALQPIREEQDEDDDY